MKENSIFKKIKWAVVGPIAIGGVLAVAGIVALAVSFSGGKAITQAQATDIALEHAGVADPASFSVKEDEEDGRKVYEVEFTADGTRYHYDVARKGGEIVNYNYDKGVQASGGTESQAPGDTPAQQADDAKEQASKPEQQQEQAESAIQAVEDALDEAEATQIAMDHAGVTECMRHRVERDYENGREVYEVEFFAGNTEYDYTIDRATGEILSYDNDIEGWGLGQGNGQGNGNGQQKGKGNGASSEGTGPITLEEAVQLVLDRVNGATSEDVRIEQDFDDGRQIYEGEVYCNRTEHEFEIDASTGTFIEWSVDYYD